METPQDTMHQAVKDISKRKNIDETDVTSYQVALQLANYVFTLKQEKL